VTRIFVMRQAFAPVGTRLRRAAATEDGGEGVLGRLSLTTTHAVIGCCPFLDLTQPHR